MMMLNVRGVLSRMRRLLEPARGLRWERRQRALAGSSLCKNHDDVKCEGCTEQDAEAAGASSGPQVGAQAEAARAQPAPKRKREESFAWDSAALATDTNELSFEEVRHLLMFAPFYLWILGHMHAMLPALFDNMSKQAFGSWVTMASILGGCKAVAESFLL